MDEVRPPGGSLYGVFVTDASRGSSGAVRCDPAAPWGRMDPCHRRRALRRRTMSADVNIKTIQTVYEAFGRGDIDAILASVTDDVDWATEANGNGAPWYGPHSGVKGVTDFFNAFGSTMEVEEFTPIAFAGNDDEVMSVVRCTAKNRETGKRMSHHLHHYFRIVDGKIAYYRGSEDTAEVTEAFSA
jgi:ketosteroid isomerase-like protein